MKAANFFRALASATALSLASTLIVQAQSTSRPAPVAYTPIALGAQVPFAISFLYPTAPTGATTLGGIPFNLGRIDIMPFPHLSLTMPATSRRPTTAYLLLNAGGAQLAGASLGRVRLALSDGTTQDTALTVGVNVREWWQAAGLVNTATGPNWMNVWNGPTSFGGPAHIDMVTIPITAAHATLSSVTVTITPGTSMALVWTGLTIASASDEDEDEDDDSEHHQPGHGHDHDKDVRHGDADHKSPVTDEAVS